jgi:Leucine-rich repeat (LRR) protein
MNEHPIDPFLAAWSAASGIDGFASRLRVYQALRLKGPWSRSRLRAALAAVLVLAPEQRDRFSETFDLWFGKDERDREVEIVDLEAWLGALQAQAADSTGPARERPRDFEENRPRARRWRWAVLGGAIALLFLFLAWRVGRGCSTPSETRDGQAASPDAEETDAGASRDGGTAQVEPWARHKLKFEITPAPPPEWNRMMLWAAVGLVTLLALIELLLAWRRSRFKTVKAKPILLSDGRLELDMASGPPPKPLSAAELDRIAFRTGLVPDFELPKLNPGKTVRQTARNGGCFSPVHDPRAQTRGLSIVRPLEMDSVSEAVLTCFAQGLVSRAVPVRILSGPPRWDTDDLVLVLVDGRAPSDPPVERWLTIPHLAFVEVRDPETWGTEVSRLPRGVFSFDADGLYAAIEVAAARRQPPRLLRVRRHDVLSSRGIEGLGNALPLAAACALLGPCDLGTADQMRRELIPWVPFLAFQCVLDLRGVSLNGQGWRISPLLGRELIERVSADFVRRVLGWQERRLAGMEPPAGSRAQKMLERERTLVRLQWQLLPGEEDTRSRTRERELLGIVEDLEAQLGEASLGRRMVERLLTVPAGWLTRPSTPKSAGHRIGRLRGDEGELFKTGDPSKRPDWFYLADAYVILGAVFCVLWARPPEAPAEWVFDLAPSNRVWVVRDGVPTSGIGDRGSLQLVKGRAPARLIGFGLGAPPIERRVAPNDRPGRVMLVTIDNGEIAKGWVCSSLPADPDPPGREVPVSIVSLPPDSKFDQPSQRLLEQRVATCIVREATMSLPVNTDVYAQTLRVERLEDIPEPREVGYSITPPGFWVRPSSVTQAEAPKSQSELRQEGKGSGPSTSANGRADQQPFKKFGRYIARNGSLDLSFTKASDISALKGMPLSSLDLTDTQVIDISTLKAMPLTRLKLLATWVSDISALKGMPLTRLDLTSTQVSDISALKGMPLSNLDLSSTKVSDISALKGMPLSNLDLSSTKVSDISALKGMPLTNLDLTSTKVSDISALKGMPLTRLDLTSTQVSDISALKGMPLSSLDLTGTQVSDISALKGMPLSTNLDLRGTQVSDISVLKGMPLSSLDLTGTQVSDISALKGMPLSSLFLGGTQVSDISVLKGMPLSSLYLAGTQVSDILALKGMPLTFLDLSGTKVINLSALHGATRLERLFAKGIVDQVKDWSPVPSRTRIDPEPHTRRVPTTPSTTTPSNRPSPALPVDGGAR